MPNILSFNITNFRGARNVTVDLGKRHRSPVVTLVGLNESGKTTILESISHFSGYDAALDDVLGHKEARQELHTFIPVADEAAFTGDVQISADIELTESDRERMRSAFAKRGMSLRMDTVGDKVSVAVRYTFKNSKYVENEVSSYWTGIDYHYIPVGKRKSRRLETSTPEEKRIWQIAVNAIRDYLPQVVYFPTFLVDMPKRIYLTKTGTEDDAKNDYYFRILQNIADVSDRKIDLNEHVVDRISEFKKEDGTALWVQNLFDSVNKRAINAVFQQMGNVVSRRIIGSWRDVIGKSANIERISFNWSVDPNYDNAPYVNFTIHDRDSEYDLNQRSLGFRWFFSFLLFTTFGGAQDRQKLYLFDEPAANLHVRGQSQLLKSFEYLTARGDQIIYSTHSAHMIDERWLGGAHIVENEAIDFESDDLNEYTPRPTNIRAVPYRQFVQKYPNRTNYFQPVLERLQHVSPSLAADRPAIILEGPSDFYALAYARKIRGLGGEWDLVPSEGSGKCGPLIGLYLGRGVPFVILLDDDAAGRRERERYMEIWSLQDGAVVTLAGLDSSLEGKAIEGLLDEESINLIVEKFGPKPSKKIISLYLAEACARAEAGWLSESSMTALENIVQKAGDLVRRS